MQIDNRTLAYQQLTRGPARVQSGDGPQANIASPLPADPKDKVKVEIVLVEDKNALPSSLRTRGLFEAGLGDTDKNADDFLQVLKKAIDGKAFDDPKAFLKTLSSKELEALQHAHGLTDAIDVDKLSQEDALNLLLPPGAQRVESQGDEPITTGAIQMTFPPENAPKDVTDAWNKAMEGVNDTERAQLETLLFLTPRDADGTGDETPMDIDAFRKGVSRALNDLKAGNQIGDEQQRALTDRLSKILEKFDKELASHGTDRKSGVQAG